MIQGLLSGVIASQSTPAGNGLPLIGHESRYISSKFEVNNTVRNVPWHTRRFLTGTALINGGDNTRFDMPTGSTFAVVTFQLRGIDFDPNYIRSSIKKNGSLYNGSFVQRYGQGWHPFNMTAIVDVTSGDYIQIDSQSDSATLQDLEITGASWIDVRVY